MNIFSKIISVTRSLQYYQVFLQPRAQNNIAIISSVLIFQVLYTRYYISYKADEKWCRVRDTKVTYTWDALLKIVIVATRGAFNSWNFLTFSHLKEISLTLVFNFFEFQQHKTKDFNSILSNVKKILCGIPLFYSAAMNKWMNECNMRKSPCQIATILK